MLKQRESRAIKKFLHCFLNSFTMLTVDKMSSHITPAHYPTYFWNTVSQPWCCALKSNILLFHSHICSAFTISNKPIISPGQDFVSSSGSHNQLLQHRGNYSAWQLLQVVFRWSFKDCFWLGKLQMACGLSAGNCTSAAAEPVDAGCKISLGLQLHQERKASGKTLLEARLLVTFNGSNKP